MTPRRGEATVAVESRKDDVEPLPAVTNQQEDQSLAMEQGEQIEALVLRPIEQQHTSQESKQPEKQPHLTAHNARTSNEDAKQQEILAETAVYNEEANKVVEEDVSAMQAQSFSSLPGT